MDATADVSALVDVVVDELAIWSPDGNKVNIVRFSTNVRPLLLYKLKMLRVVSPKSKVQQRITIKKIANDGCGSACISKNINRWQPLLTKRALVFA